MKVDRDGVRTVPLAFMLQEELKSPNAMVKQVGGLCEVRESLETDPTLTAAADGIAQNKLFVLAPWGSRRETFPRAKKIIIFTGTGISFFSLSERLQRGRSSDAGERLLRRLLLLPPERPPLPQRGQHPSPSPDAHAKTCKYFDFIPQLSLF